MFDGGKKFYYNNVAAIFPCSDWGLTKGNIVNMEVTPSKNNNGGGKESRKVGGREVVYMKPLL